MRYVLLLGTALVFTGCDGGRGGPGQDDGVQKGSGRPASTPTRQLTITNSVDQPNVPREGGNLDRGATRENNPSKYNPLDSGETPGVDPTTRTRRR